MHMRRRYRLQLADRPAAACNEEHISVVGPPDAIRELNKLIKKTPDLLIDTGVTGLRPERTETPPPVYAYVNGKWRGQDAQSETAIALSLQTYAYDLRPQVTPPDVSEKLKHFLKVHESSLLRKITVCVDPVLDSPFEGGDAPFEGGDAPFEGGDAPFEGGDAPFEGGDAPFEGGDAPFEGGDAPFEGGDAPFEGGDAPFEGGDAPFEGGDAPFEGGDAPFEGGDAPLAVDPMIASYTIAGQPAMERTGFNWLRQARPELTGSDVTVLILDTLPVQGGIDVPNEYVDFWVDWVGDKAPTADPAEKPPVPPVIPAAEIHRYHGVLVASLVRHLAPASTIVAARVLDDRGSGWSTTLIQAILWALSHRKNKTMIDGRRLIHDKLILNMSMGLPRTQAEESEAVCLLRTLNATARAAVLAVAASGNDSWHKPENPVEPAAYGFFADTRATATQVIAVAGTNHLTQYAFFSNEGHIAAPCRHIIGDTGPNSQIQQKHGSSTVRWSGTSFATPQVTGLTALLWSSGRVPYRRIKQHIWRTCHLPRRWNGVREIDFMRAFRAI